MKTENIVNNANTRFLVPVLFSVMVVVALVAGLWPFETSPENGARLNGKSLEFKGAGIAGACASAPLFPSGEATVELSAVARDFLMDRSGAMITFYDAAGSEVLSVSQWGGRAIVSSGTEAVAGARSAFSKNKWTSLLAVAGKGGTALYIDGKMGGSSPKPLYGLEKAECFTLGASPEGRHPWHGSLRRLALWKRALSPEEARLSSARAAASSLIGLYRFDGSGFSVKNSVSGELQISLPEVFQPAKRVFLGPVFEDGGRFRFDGVDGAVNFAGFFPLGLLAYLLGPAARSRGAKMIFAVSVCFVLSLAIETAQVFMPERFSQLSDLLLNTSGASAGALFGMFFGKKVRGQ